MLLAGYSASGKGHLLTAGWRGTLHIRLGGDLVRTTPGPVRLSWEPHAFSFIIRELPDLTTLMTHFTGITTQQQSPAATISTRPKLPFELIIPLLFVPLIGSHQLAHRQVLRFSNFNSFPSLTPWSQATRPFGVRAIESTIVLSQRNVVTWSSDGNQIKGPLHARNTTGEHWRTLLFFPLSPKKSAWLTTSNF